MAGFQFVILIWAWMLFLFNEFFMLIILTNFLIAIISQSYDDVMSKEQIFNYMSKCDLNIEAAILKDAYHNLFVRTEPKPFRLFYVVCAAADGEDGGEFEGFVKTIKNAIKRYANKVIES